MRWENKGHEYDDMYLNIEKQNSFYLFGAGDYGNLFYNLFKDEIKILGYIDNNREKQGKEINKLVCFSLDQINLGKDEGIIVTMSQIARINPVEQLNRLGYKRNENFYIIEEFISVFQAYKNNKVFFSSISFLPSTACNLNCRYCLNFNPFAKKFFVREWEDLKKDIDLFFNCVDYVMLFHISGGEPFIYKNTVDLIEYIDKNYRNKIGTLRTVTNGTQVLSDDVLERLTTYRVELTVDDYRNALPEYADSFEMLIQKLNKYKIKYYINKVDSWIDLAPEKTDYSDKTEDWIINHRDMCNQSWQELRDGKLYSCNYAAYATVAGIAGEQDIEEVYDLKVYTPSKMKELIEFRLGYTSKGYTNFCKKCRGFTSINTEQVEVASQAREEIFEYRKV